MFEASCQGGFLDLQGTLCVRQKSILLWSVTGILELICLCRRVFEHHGFLLFFKKAFTKTARVTGVLTDSMFSYRLPGKILNYSLTEQQEMLKSSYPGAGFGSPGAGKELRECS